jgi:hypothetical protein
MKQKIQEMLLQNFSYNEIVKKIGCKKSTISYHAKKLGLDKKPKNQKEYDWDLISKYYNSGKSFKETQKYFGFSNGAWDGAIKNNKIIPRIREIISLEDLLVENRKQTNRGYLKARLLKEGLLENKCYGINCNITDSWLGKPLVLQLEHINGHNKDNRIENLCLLCPNCHSQTPTFAGKSCNKNKFIAS